MKTNSKNRSISHQVMAGFAVLFLMCITIVANAQTESKDRLMKMIENGNDAIDAIVGCNESVQSNILEVAKTPEVLDRMADLQQRSQKLFRETIQDYDQDVQSGFYDLARYPDLISDIVRNGRSSSIGINGGTANYPKEILVTAERYARSYYEVLVRIDRLNNEIDKTFQLFLEPYSPRVRESVKTLLSYPEVISAMVENRDFADLLGRVYTEDAVWVVNRLTTISHQAASQKKEDIENYKSSIEKDPEAYSELLSASEQFARENNDLRRYDNYNEPYADVRVVANYPYWFGYPYWFSFAAWRPYPSYYYTGLYRNHSGNVVFWGLPSYGFIRWHTYNHPREFSHLNYHYYNYYENHYNLHENRINNYYGANGFYRSVRENVINNPRINNQSMRRIDEQRGNNIVRQPDYRSTNISRRGNGNNYNENRSNSGFTFPQRNSNSGNFEKGASDNYRFQRPGGNEGRFQNDGGNSESTRRRIVPSDVQKSGPTEIRKSGTVPVSNDGTGRGFFRGRSRGENTNNTVENPSRGSRQQINGKNENSTKVERRPAKAATVGPDKSRGESKSRRQEQ